MRLLAPLAADLKEWRLASGRPGDDALVFPTDRGEIFNAFDWKNWHRRVFRPAAQAVGLERIPPYDLRHSFISLLIHEGASIVEVARQAGNSPSVALDTYGHVFDEALERAPAEAVS